MRFKSISAMTNKILSWGYQQSKSRKNPRLRNSPKKSSVFSVKFIFQTILRGKSGLVPGKERGSG